MNVIRRAFDLDPDTDARLRTMAAERGLEQEKVLAEAVALLDSLGNFAELDVAEDRRRLENFKRTREAIPLGEIVEWVKSWDTPNELPRPKPRRIE